MNERSVKFDFWEEDDDIRDEEEGDLYSERALMSEDDDMDPIAAGVMLGYLAG